MKKILFVFLIILMNIVAHPCSTFLLKGNNTLLFGRNYDWITGVGLLHTNLKGLSKTSVPVDGKSTINWVSQYGSISFNQFGKEFPNGGMNEKGLVIEIMWLEETAYPKQDTRPSMHVLQWVQYQLDNCSTVKEVLATEELFRISGNSGAPIHYLIADATGNAATIEFIKGKRVVHTGSSLKYPVLTNSTYQRSVQLTDADNRLDNSIDRFATACSMIQSFQKADNKVKGIDYSFSILNAISQGNYTKWSVVYDIKNRFVYFKTNDANDIKHIAFEQLDFSCKKGPLAFDIKQKVKGNIRSHFQPYSFESNLRLTKQALQESSNAIQVNEKEQAVFFNYPKTTVCQ